MSIHIFPNMPVDKIQALERRTGLHAVIHAPNRIVLTPKTNHTTMIIAVSRQRLPSFLGDDRTDPPPTAA